MEQNPQYRAKIYRVIPISPSRHIKLPVAYGPWVDEEKRALNLVSFLNLDFEGHEAWLQTYRLISA